jgi:hypothetical protein
VTAAPSGVWGFDTDTQLAPTPAAAFVAAGLRFAIGYLTMNGPESSSDLTNPEAQDILNAGLALMAVQHVQNPGWVPNADLGTQYGRWAATNAQTVGFPPGVSIWLDLEGVANGTVPSDVIDYCNIWYAAVATAGYIPGIYVGADSILTGDQLYEDLYFQYYWQSGSEVPEMPTRGYCMVQSVSSSDDVDGVAYDRDVTEMDNLGNTPFWLVRTSVATMSTTTSGGREPGLSALRGIF